MSKITFVALALLMVVTGCQTSDIETVVRQSLPTTCRLAETARPAVTVAIEAGKLTGKRRDAVEAAYASLDPLCDDPASVTAADALAAAVSAYLTISNALKSAQ